MDQRDRAKALLISLHNNWSEAREGVGIKQNMPSKYHFTKRLVFVMCLSITIFGQSDGNKILDIGKTTYTNVNENNALSTLSNVLSILKYCLIIYLRTIRNTILHFFYFYQ